jgi:hypothetical protein
MTDCKDIKYCSFELLKVVKNRKRVLKHDEGKIIILLQKYIDRLIFNISAICALIALKIGVAKIYEKHTEFLLEYVDKLCAHNKKQGARKMKGGVFNTAAFYGIAEPAYKEEYVGANIQNIDFANNIARPALHQINMGGLMGGGCGCSVKANGGGKPFSCNKLNIIINRKIKQVFRHFNVNVNKASLKIIFNKFNTILADLISKLHKISGDITLSKAKVVFKKYKIMKNDI